MASQTHNPFARTVRLIGVWTGLTMLIMMSLLPATSSLHGAAPAMLGAPSTAAGSNAHVILGMLMILIGLSVHGLFLLRHEHPVSGPAAEESEERDAELYAERHMWLAEGNRS